MKVIYFIFFFIIPLIISQERFLQFSGDFELPKYSVPFTQQIELYYQFTSDSIIMAFKLKDTQFGDTAFHVGWGKDMKDSDVWTFELSNTKEVIVKDRWSVNHQSPLEDTLIGGSEDLIVLGYLVSIHETIVKVQRKLVTGDNKDKPILLGDNQMIWAYTAGVKVMDRHMQRGTVTVKLVDHEKIVGKTGERGSSHEKIYSNNITADPLIAGNHDESQRFKNFKPIVILFSILSLAILVPVGYKLYKKYKLKTLFKFARFVNR